MSRTTVLVLAAVTAFGWPASGAAGISDPSRYPGNDTLGWCEYNSNGSGNTEVL